jgi:hypothetical protein
MSATPSARSFPDELPSHYSIGRIAPLVLVVWALLDVGLRLLPLNWLHINPVQVATRIPGRYSPFIPNLRLNHNHPVGELALMGNLPPSETRPPIRFTTDRLGFRATPGPASAGTEILLFEGDSFTFGASLSDEETLAAELARQLNTAVYNGGRFFTDPERLIELDWLLDRLPRKPQTMVYVLMETVDLNPTRNYDQGAIDRIGPTVVGASAYSSAKDDLRYANRFFRLWWQISPLKITAQRAFKWLADDAKLPNSYRRSLEERSLPDGRRFLIERRYIDRHLNPPDQRTTVTTARYLAGFAEQVRQRGMDFWVLLVPEALSLYGPWLLTAEESRGANRPAYLDRLGHVLASQGLQVINGLAVLRPWAAEDIATGDLAYYREDHHWTPLGVSRIAAAIAGALKNGGPIVRSPTNTTASR